MLYFLFLDLLSQVYLILGCEFFIIQWFTIRIQSLPFDCNTIESSSYPLPTNSSCIGNIKLHPPKILSYLTLPYLLSFLRVPINKHIYLHLFTNRGEPPQHTSISIHILCIPYPLSSPTKGECQLLLPLLLLLIYRYLQILTYMKI